jgi:hypothetical protein
LSFPEQCGKANIDELRFFTNIFSNLKKFGRMIVEDPDPTLTLVLSRNWLGRESLKSTQKGHLKTKEETGDMKQWWFWEHDLGRMSGLWTLPFPQKNIVMFSIVRTSQMNYRDLVYDLQIKVLRATFYSYSLDDMIEYKLLYL